MRAVSEFIMSRNGTWLVFVTLHSYSQLWMAPWGYTDDRPDDYNRLVSNRIQVISIFVVIIYNDIFGW